MASGTVDVGWMTILVEQQFLLTLPELPANVQQALETVPGDTIPMRESSRQCAAGVPPVGRPSGILRDDSRTLELLWFAPTLLNPRVPRGAARPPSSNTFSPGPARRCGDRDTADQGRGIAEDDDG